MYFKGSALTLGFSTDDDDARSYWARASKFYVASARKRASLHIFSGPSADQGCDAPLQQRDVFVRTFSSLLHRTKRWKDICAVWGLLMDIMSRRQRPLSRACALDSSGHDPSLVRNASHPLHSIITTFWLRARALHTWPPVRASRVLTTS